MTSEQLDRDAAGIAHMTPEQRDHEAALLYEDRIAERGPRWSQLGEVTRSVWIEYVLAGERVRLW